MAEEQANDTDTSKGSQVAGKVKEALGWATGDRRVEAEGQLQQLDAEQPDAKDDRADAAEAVEEAELEVRAEHGDLAPDVVADHELEDQAQTEKGG